MLVVEKCIFANANASQKAAFHDLFLCPFKALGLPGSARFCDARVPFVLRVDRLLKKET